jgi:threonine dehydrogenase-like Zn-dependent dehydrogenase
VRALTVHPAAAGSATLAELPEPAVTDGHLSIEPLLVGICGTDREIVAGHYGTAPAGQDHLVLGHETVARVLDAPDGAGMAAGDLVVPIVRRPDPVPCRACAAGEWDMCENGRYTEHGINGADGYARERAGLDPAFAVPVPAALGDHAVLVEPASVVAKAWEQIERIGARATWAPRTVLVTGAGPVGLLAALMARQRGFDTYVLDRVTDGPKPRLVHELGATYTTGPMRDLPRPDVVIECTGVGSVVLDAIEHAGRNGIVCLAGISSGARTIELDAAALNRRMVLENDVVFGSVNANRRHYLLGVDALTAAPRSWLDATITRRVPLARWSDALRPHPGDVKVVLDVAARMPA